MKNFLTAILAGSMLFVSMPTLAAFRTSFNVSNVALSQTDQTMPPSLSFDLTNNLGTRKVLADVELYSSFGTRFGQYVFDNVSFHKGQTRNIQITPNLLPAGNYFYSVGVFNRNWGKRIAWFDAVASFSFPTQAGQQIFMRDIQRPKQNLTQGTAFTVTPDLISTADINNATIYVYLNSSQSTIAYESSCPNVNFVSGQVQACAMNAPGTLPVGSYTISVRVFDSGGNLLQEFTNQGTIVIQ